MRLGKAILRAINSLPLAALLLLAACASEAPPLTPSVLVVPGSGKSFDAFRADESDCRKDAASQAGNVSDAKLLQHRYDFAYQRCMSSRGHKTPPPPRGK